MISEQELLKLVRRACRKSGSQAAFARAIGISATTLSAILAGDRKPSKKLLAALEHERVAMPPKYRQKEVL